MAGWAGAAVSEEKFMRRLRAPLCDGTRGGASLGGRTPCASASRKGASKEKAGGFPPAFVFSPDGAFAPYRSMSVSRRSDRKSTRLNSSHVKISYAVFCLKKKTKK